MKTKLNIGCGYNYLKGFINIDKSKEVKPDLVVDVEKELPFEDNSFKHIYSEHCLEHIRPQYWKGFLNEIQRVAKNNCVLELYLPFDNLGQRTNVDHYRTFSWNSFDPFLEDSNRSYYSNLTLKRLIKSPNKLIKLFYHLFPFLKYEVYFKFKIIKSGENKMIIESKGGNK